MTPVHETVIRAPSRMASLDFRELFAYRDLLFGRVRKNLKAQFGDMYLGYLWAVGQPIIVVAVFVWLKKASAAQMNVTLPYPLWVFSGLIVWYYFVEATTAVSSSARRDASLLKKVYFPRLLTPAVPVFEHLFTLVVGLVPLTLMMLWYGVRPGWQLVLLPLLVVQLMALVLGLGCLWSAWSLNGADLDRVLRHLFYVGLFLSPVLYAPGGSSVLASSWLHVNPMTGTLLAFRSCLFDGVPFPLRSWLYSAAVSAALLVIGVRKYRLAESDFLDQL